MKKVTGLLVTVILLAVSIPAFASEREEFFSMEGRKFWSLGFNMGTAFATPLLIFNIDATVAPLSWSFFELGAEFGSMNGKAGENVEIRNVQYSSNYYYARVNSFVPYGKRIYDSYGKPKEGGGWYLGLGLGVMSASYAYIQSETERSVATVQTPTLDGATGFFIGRGHILFKAGYAIRTTMDMKNLIGVNHRLLLGVNYRIY